MTKRVSLLLALSIALGIHTPCYGLYVMVRSGFGELKADQDIGQWLIYPTQRIGCQVFGFYRDRYCTSGPFKYKDHKNLSVALGERFDVFDIGSLGLELEIIGAYANADIKRNKTFEWCGYTLPACDLYVFGYRILDNPHPLLLESYRFFYLKNQRIAGVQINAYWEQYILDWLSVGIGGGLGSAYVCTKFTKLEFCATRVAAPNVWLNSPLTNRRKYVHSGSLLYNFTLFVRAEQFETLFEVGYRHIGLHQMFGAKCYGYTIPKLANLHSDQVYVGVGRTF